MPIAISIIASLVTSYAVVKTAPVFHPDRYDDKQLLSSIEKALSGSQNNFNVSQTMQADLHGLDHTSLVIAGYSRDASQLRGTLGKIAIMDKSDKDYDALMTIQSNKGPSEPYVSKLSDVQIQVTDLDYDGKDEIVGDWADDSASGIERHVAIIGWDSEYAFLTTVPPLSNESYMKLSAANGLDLLGNDEIYQMAPEADSAPVSRTYLQLQEKDSGVTRVCELNSCTHVTAANVDNDPFIEVLCADMVWTEREWHHGPHSHIIRAFELHDSKLVADPAWNGGAPLLWQEKIPEFHFRFTDEMIMAGRDIWVKNSGTSEVYGYSYEMRD